MIWWERRGQAQTTLGNNSTAPNASVRSNPVRTDPVSQWGAIRLTQDLDLKYVKSHEPSCCVWVVRVGKASAPHRGVGPNQQTERSPYSNYDHKVRSLKHLRNQLH